MKCVWLLCGLTLLGLAATLVSAAGTTYNLVDFSKPQTPGVDLGAEFPGAQATATWTPADAASPAYVRLNYDFSKGGAYTQLYLDGFFAPNITDITFTARGNGHPGTMIRLVDAKGECFQLRQPLANEAWQEVTCQISEAMPGYERWAGDGRFDQPVRSVHVGVEAAKTSGAFDLRAVTITTTENQAALNSLLRDYLLQHLRFSTGVPGNLLFPGSKNAGVLTVANAPSIAPPLMVMPTILNLEGRAQGTPRAVTLSAKNGFTAAIPMPSAMGYYQLAFAVNGETRLRSSFAVIPDNRTPDKCVASPFGVNTHFNQGWDLSFAAIVKRAGIAWMRDGEASLEDKAIEAAKAQQLCYLPCFTWYRKPLAEKHQRADGSWDFSEVAAQYRQYAEKYGDYVDHYDLVNEPHAEWASVFGGSWDGGAWVVPFTTLFGKQVTAALKAGDPGAKVLWEDIDQMLWYKQFYAADPQCPADILSPHTYNLHRSNPLPEQQAVLQTMPEFLRFTRQYNLPWQVWAGEVGFASYTMDPANPPMFYVPSTEPQQAQLLVRMMVSQLAAGVDKIFWYDLRNDGMEPNNPEHNFGLTNNDGTPKPSIVAYANFIHQLGGGIGAWLGRVDTTEDLHAFLPTNGNPVVIAWTRSGQTSLTLEMPTGVASVTITDIYGRSRTLPVRNNRLQLLLTESPIYLGGLSVDAVRAVKLVNARVWR